MVETKENPPFNFAISTLERINQILNEIKYISMTIALGENEDGQYIEKTKALECKITLIRQFFISAVPLLVISKIEENKINDFVNRLDTFEIKKIKKIFEDPNNTFQQKKTMFIEDYDKELDKKLDFFVIELEIILKKYFMPPSDDPRFASKRE